MLEGLKNILTLSFIRSNPTVESGKKTSIADQKVKNIAPSSVTQKSDHTPGKVISAQFTETKSKLEKRDFPKSLEEKQKLCDQFKVGDVVVTHLTGFRHVESVDPIIVMLQHIARFFGRSSSAADSSIVHVSIVVGIDREKGQVLISEAMPSRKKGGLRTVDLLSDRSCILDKGMGYKYQILHPTTSYVETAQKAAQIAQRYAPKSSYLRESGLNSEDSSAPDKSKSKFSFILALRGMFKRFDIFDTKAKRRVFKGIFDEHARTTVLTAGTRPRKVFCSAFGAHLFQKTEAQKAWKTLCERHSELQDKLNDLTAAVRERDLPNAEKQISKWATEMEKEYGKELEQEMKQFKIDYKVTVPQDFVYYFKKENILAPAFDLVPPAA